MRGTLTALALALGALALGACGDGGKASSTVAGEEGARIAPLQISGTGSAQFRVEGADNSIANYGSQAPAAELRAAARVTHGYLVALANEEWAGACSYLSHRQLANLERLAARLKRQGCVGALARLFGEVSAAEAREATTLDAAALRREGAQGFLLYRGPQGEGYFFSLVREGGRWAVAGLGPSALS